MDTAQWPQEMVVKPMEEILIPINNNNNTECLNSKVNNGNEKSSLERKMRPQKAQAVNCPRCNSTNTKFCYYNNYSLSQPRYFCKTCRRYWTEGGSLRNIPVGGGSRKNKKTLPSNNNSSKKTPHDLGPSSTNNTLIISSHDQNHNPKLLDQGGQDLNLGYDDFKTISQLIQVPNFEDNDNKSHLSGLELLNGNSNNSYMNGSTMPIHNDHMYSSGFSSLPTLGFSLDGIGNNNNGYGVEESGNIGRVLFPFEDLKQGSSTINDHNLESSRDNQQGDISTGYWNGVLGGGSW